MNPTLPTSQPSEPTSGEMLTEVIDLSTGFGVAFLPALLLAVPCIVLVVIPPLILVLVLAAPLAVLAGPPYLLVRLLRRRRHLARPEVRILSPGRL